MARVAGSRPRTIAAYQRARRRRSAPLLPSPVGHRLALPRSASAATDHEIYDTTDDAAPQETDQQDENHAQRELPGRAKVQRRLQEVAQKEPERGADQRAEQGAGARRSTVCMTSCPEVSKVKASGGIKPAGRRAGRRRSPHRRRR